MTRQPPRPLRVLAVDDCQDARESLCMLLRLWRYACEAASSGPEAVRAAESFRPDVVLMDIGMPGMDGWQAAREMRKVPGLERTAFVATTGYGGDADVDHSHAEGFAAHLTKPFEPAQLCTLLAGLAVGRTGLAK